MCDEDAHNGVFGPLLSQEEALIHHSRQVVQVNLYPHQREKECVCALGVRQQTWRKCFGELAHELGARTKLSLFFKSKKTQKKTKSSELMLCTLGQLFEFPEMFCMN